MRRELAGARRKIEALRATGAEMQLSLEARDAALAELRGRTAEMLAGALERADLLMAERDEARRLLDEALERIAVLEGGTGAGRAGGRRRIRPGGRQPCRREGQASAGALPEAAPDTPPGDPGPRHRTPGRPSARGGRRCRASRRSRLPARAGAGAAGRVAGVEAVGEGRYVLAASPLFAPGQAALSQRGQADLQPIADHLRRWLADLPPDTAWRLHVDGHADDASVRQGAFKSGLELARARAGAVANYLAERGLPAGRLAVDGGRPAAARSRRDRGRAAPTRDRAAAHGRMRGGAPAARSWLNCSAASLA